MQSGTVKRLSIGASREQKEKGVGGFANEANPTNLKEREPLWGGNLHATPAPLNVSISHCSVFTSKLDLAAKAFHPDSSVW